jgi:hypothetical protein
VIFAHVRGLISLGLRDWRAAWCGIFSTSTCGLRNFAGEMESDRDGFKE